MATVFNPTVLNALLPTTNFPATAVQNLFYIDSDVYS
jgi:hypothetical protein